MKLLISSLSCIALQVKRVFVVTVFSESNKFASNAFDCLILSTPFDYEGFCCHINLGNGVIDAVVAIRCHTGFYEYRMVPSWYVSLKQCNTMYNYDIMRHDIYVFITIFTFAVRQSHTLTPTLRLHRKVTSPHTLLNNMSLHQVR